MLITAMLLLALQTPDSTLAQWQTALRTAEASGDMEAEIGRLTGTEDRVSLCTLDGAVTILRCYHSTQRMVDGVQVVNHSAPAEYDGIPLADVFEAERLWVTPAP